jgi:branched-chain amino acid transport system ATP-binding protein
VTAVLELDRVCAAYGPFRALFDISFSIEPGEAVALLGPNGVGKTTVARVASGLVAPTSGRVAVCGEELAGAPAWRYARAGVAHAPEGRSVFATLSVEDNLLLSFRQSKGRKDAPAALDRAFELFPMLAPRRKQLAGTLSGGQQRMLSMSRVMVEEPKLLIADELSLGLAPIVVDQVYDTLEKLRAAGASLLIVEQHVPHALALCDRVVLLEHGTICWSGSSTDAAGEIEAQIFRDARDEAEVEAEADTEAEADA